MYATCGACGLKHVIYQERGAAVHMTRSPSPEPMPHGLHFVDMPDGFVMLDAGCQTSVGGSEWHQALQAELDTLGIAYASEDLVEYFKFGDGTTVTSTRTWTYRLALSGMLADITIADVPGTLPGLLSPDATGQFGLQVDFAKSRWRVPKGTWKPLQYTASGHIRLPVLQYPAAVHVLQQESADSGSHDSADEMCQGQPWLASQSSDTVSEEDASSSTSESQRRGVSDLITDSSPDASE